MSADVRCRHCIFMTLSALFLILYCNVSDPYSTAVSFFALFKHNGSNAAIIKTASMNGATFFKFTTDGFVFCLQPRMFEQDHCSVPTELHLSWSFLSNFEGSILVQFQITDTKNVLQWKCAIELCGSLFVSDSAVHKANNGLAIDFSQAHPLDQLYFELVVEEGSSFSANASAFQFNQLDNEVFYFFVCILIEIKQVRNVVVFFAN